MILVGVKLQVVARLMLIPRVECCRLSAEPQEPLLDSLLLFLLSTFCSGSSGTLAMERVASL
jgi:hypothetical protein